MSVENRMSPELPNPSFQLPPDALDLMAFGGTANLSSEGDQTLVTVTEPTRNEALAGDIPVEEISDEPAVEQEGEKDD